MTKQELRLCYKEKRAALTEKERLRLDDLLLIQFQQYALPADVHVLLSYWPLNQHTEVNTHLMADFLQFRIPGLQIAYPVADFTDYSMKLYLADNDTDYRVNSYGIAEPINGTPITAEEIDMVFVPLLAFDKRGYRVGYGKGFYDRLLTGCREDIIKTGFSFFEPVDSIEDIDQFDVPLTSAITPNSVYEF